MSQYSIEKDEFLNTNKSIYECFMLADSVTGELNSDYYRAFVNAGYYTPKGRLQTSQQQVTYFSTNIFASGNDFWDNYTANNATIIHLPNESAILMSVANTVGSECIRQTKQVMQYVPGRTAVANGMSVLYGIGDVGGGSIEFEASDAKSSTFQLGRSNLGANTDTFTIVVASTGTNDVFDTVIRWREAR